MTAEERRASIIQQLRQSSTPISATALAKGFGVSRQIVVGDVALLRASGADIAATPRGYVMEQTSAGCLHRVACRHSGKDMEAELNIMVDNGCTVVDVVVEHPVYGQLTGALQLKSRYDVQQFISQSAQAKPLSLLTEGIHLHTLCCPDDEAFRRVCAALDQAGYLLKG